MWRDGPSVPSGSDDKQTSRGTNKGVWRYGIFRKQSSAISVFLVLDIFFQRMEIGGWTDVRTLELRLWLLLGSVETSSFLALCLTAEF